MWRDSRSGTNMYVIEWLWDNYLCGVIHVADPPTGGDPPVCRAGRLIMVTWDSIIVTDDIMGKTYDSQRETESLKNDRPKINRLNLD